MDTESMTCQFCRKWYCHTHPYTVQLTGNQIESSFNRYGDPEVDHMVSMWKLVRKEEAELFPGLPKRFKVIPDPRLGSELMEAERSSDLNYDYIATLINEEHTDVRIEAAKKILILREHMDSWAVYVVDMKKKICLVMDLVETEEPWHEVGAKHRRNAIRMLSNLCRCIHECIPGARISSAGWALDYNTAMHTCCGREESWINAMYYLREYTGEKLQGLTDMLFDRTRSTTWDAYQLVTMQENMAVLPWCMREPEEED